MKLGTNIKKISGFFLLRNWTDCLISLYEKEKLTLRFKKKKFDLVNSQFTELYCKYVFDSKIAWSNDILGAYCAFQITSKNVKINKLVLNFSRRHRGKKIIERFDEIRLFSTFCQKQNETHLIQIVLFWTALLFFLFLVKFWILKMSLKWDWVQNSVFAKNGINITTEKFTASCSLSFLYFYTTRWFESPDKLIHADFSTFLCSIFSNHSKFRGLSKSENC